MPTLLALAIAAVIACGTAFGAGWHYGAKGPTAKLVALQAKYDAEDAARVAALAQRRADDERAIARLRAAQAESESALRQAVARAADADKRVTALAAKLRASPAGGCLLPPDARRVFDRAAGPGGSAAPGPAAAPDREAPSPGASASTDAADDLAPRPGDAAPVDCVTAWEVGTRNTARATFNADALDACNASLIGQWQACTGKTFPQ